MQVIEPFLLGMNGTIFAYGQTGSGKTFTMGSSANQYVDESETGIIPRALTAIFDHLYKNNVTFEIKSSLLEIYNEEIYDLLSLSTKDTTSSPSKSSIQLREDNHGNVYVTGATEKDVKTKDEALNLLYTGLQTRTTASTLLNVHSSRSHAIFSLTLRQWKKNSSGIEGWVVSKFHFVDLAGSERLKRTKAEGDRKKEGIAINQGLHVLGKVISALTDEKGNAHVPYRDSKLTRFLQNSLGGNSRTLMLACISPLECDISETLNTLKYASRARNIKNTCKINFLSSASSLGGMSVTEVNKILEENELLKWKLRQLEDLLGANIKPQQPEQWKKYQVMLGKIRALKAEMELWSSSLDM
ncbi:P-loop containing nucleoside triphosphate hydrolase protein [Paraphysoderma sedebokerense]|nr:P-loop containing nucleoside triphosphate hydrolase protein [Paraphysoderma sedebokerense]